MGESILTVSMIYADGCVQVGLPNAIFASEELV
jgi:hypothetical protein